MSKPAVSCQKILEQLQAISDRPLVQRCNLMEDILKTVNSKELRHILPSLLHEIFDFDRNQYSGWRIDCISRANNGELCHRIRNLLGPEGLMMRLINTLHGDPYAHYEFSLEWLPAPTRHLIAEGAFPSFYVNKLQLQSPTSSVLVLNAFELYMFHLAYALVSQPWRNRCEGWSTVLDYVYPMVIDDMLHYFFPCDKSSLPSSPQFTSTPVRQQGNLSPTLAYGLASQQQLNSSVSGVTSPQHTLFKSSFINAQKQHQQNLATIDQADTETWQSETFLQVLAEFWLNQNSGPGIEPHSLSSTFQEHFMPSLKHVKMVRLVVKYLHYFANSHTSLVTSSYQQAVISPLDQFKRLVIPLFLQKKLYGFLRHAFERWPLDSCFRMVLETWLSYIQPWRYVGHPNNPGAEGRGSETDLLRKVDDKWDQFVEDNLLFYSVLLNEFLPRIHRMDLASPVSAYMVYRVSRIFSLSNLSNLIFKAEQEVFGFLSQTGLSGSYLGNLPHYVQAALPPQIIDLEGPNFQCPKFFSELMRQNIALVIDDLRHALLKVRAQHEELEHDKKQRSKGFFATLFGSSDSNKKLESTPEFKQLPIHLENSVTNYCSIFDIPVPPGVSSSSTSVTGSSSVGGLTSSSASLNQSVANDSMYLADGDRHPDCMHTDTGLQLTDLGRSQLLNRECRFDKFDTGDPDLLPVRSYENATVVRLLFHFCLFFNSYFKTELTSLYLRSDVVGHFSRVFVTAPVTAKPDRISSFDSSCGKKGASSHYLEQSYRPRISLRFLASYHNLLHLGIIYLLYTLLFGYGLLSFLFVLIFFVLFYASIVAIYRFLTNKPTPLQTTQ